MRKIGFVFLVFSFVVSLVISDRPQRTETKPVADRHTPLKEIGSVVFLPIRFKVFGPYKVKLPHGPTKLDVEPALTLIVQQPRSIAANIITEAPPVTAPIPVTAAKSASGSVEAVISYAMAQLGKPYVWGASGPSAFDCSGLVMRAYEQIGLLLPHFTGALISNGQSVSEAELQLGDIVFPNKGHVGIYVGNNQIIHAPQAGDVVKISFIWGFYAARRLV